MKPYSTAVGVLNALAAILASHSPALAEPTPPAGPTQFTGTVATRDGKPATDATVTLDMYDYRTKQVANSQTTKPDQNGHFAFTVTLAHYRGVYPVFFAASPQGIAASEYRPDGPFTITIEPLTSLHLHFQDGDGKPVSNVQVVSDFLVHQNKSCMLGKSLSPQWVQTTDAAGNATISGLPQGDTLAITVEGDHFAPLDHYGQIALSNTAATPDQTFHLTPACSISGTVLYGSTNAPAAGVSLQALPVSQGEPGSLTVTDASGHYSFKGLHSGAYYVETGSNAGNDINAAAAAKSVLLPDATNLSNIDITLIPGVILAGTVRDKTTGKPLEGMMVYVYGPAHPGNVSGADLIQTGPDGRFRFRLPPGNQRLLVTEQGPTSNTVQQEIQMPVGSMRYVDVDTDAPDIAKIVHGIVLGPDGKPVPGAEVLAANRDPDNGTKITDSNGRFAFDEPGLPSRAQLFAHSGDLYTAKPTAASGDGDVVLRLSPGTAEYFQGQVIDGTIPVANARVTLIRWIPAQNIGIDTLTATSNTQGRYKIGPVYPGFTYSIDATASGYGNTNSSQIPPAPGKLTDVPVLTIQKADSFVGGTVVDPAGNPVAGASVTYTNDTNLQVVTDSKGRFHISGVTRDTADIQIQAPSERFASVQIPSGTDKNVITVKSQDERTIEGQKFQAAVDADTTNHGDGANANKLLQTAEQSAAAGGKQVLLVFHASWCGPCFMLHRFLNDPKNKPVIDAHFVVQDIDIWETNNKGWENPGGTDLYKKYGGPNSVPYFVVLDKSGKKRGSSIFHGQNMGVPSQPKEIQFFLNTLKSASPSLSASEESTLQAGLKRHSTF